MTARECDNIRLGRRLAIAVATLCACTSLPPPQQPGGTGLQPRSGLDLPVGLGGDASGTTLADGAAVLADGGTTVPDTAAAPPDLPQGDPDYLGPACTTNAACKDHEGKPYCAKTISQCVACLLALHCKAPLACKDFACIEFSCIPGSAECEGTFLNVCRPDGKGYDTQPCPDATPTCSDGKCVACEPGKAFCAKPTGTPAESKALMQCNADGSAATVKQPCAGAQICQGGKCQVCVPGTKQCTGDKALACKDDGSALETIEDCSQKGLTCLGGLCVNPCASDIKSKTNVGCDYWAVDLDNALEIGGNGQKYDAQNAQFAVIVSNTTDQPATVTVTLGPDKTAPGVKTKTFTVAAKGLLPILLPDSSWGLPPQNQEGTGINKLAYRIQSSQPIVAYQFNPLQNYGVFSNDASLLIPSTALDKEYWILSRAQLGNYRGYLTVIATQPGKTDVKVVVAAKTLAGGIIPPMKKGDSKTFALQQGEVLNIETDDITGGDLTGSYILADRPVAVFGGSEASNSPSIGKCVPGMSTSKVCAGTGGSMMPQMCTKDESCQPACCADHLEEQMWPVAALGKQYVGGRLYPRGQEKDAWRLLAVQNDTHVSLTPSIGVAVPTLAQGQWFEFETTADFVIDSDKPLLVGHYMASSHATMTKDPAPCTTDASCQAQYGFAANCLASGFQKFCNPIGDPALMLGVATTQYLDDYLFLVPSQYKLNYMNILAPLKAQVQLDGQPLLPGLFQPIAGTGFSVARLAIAPGAHRLKADKKFGLYVYGYDKDVSYGYAGGAGLEAK